MGHKYNPIGMRVGINRPWRSLWFFRRRAYRDALLEDNTIREYIEKTFRSAAIKDVVIERSGPTIRVNIQSARPGLLIGKGGKGIELMRDTVESKLRAIRQTRGQKRDRISLKIDVTEVRQPETHAQVVALQIAHDLERRLPSRRAMRQALEKIRMSSDLKGMRIRLAGRLDGNEIARTIKAVKGTVPLQTIRANIDYGFAQAYTTYGVIGIKVWIYKGEVFA